MIADESNPPDAETSDVSTYHADNWLDMLIDINKAVKRARIIINLPQIAYISEFNQLYNDLRDIKDDDPTATFYQAAAHMFTNPQTYIQFCCNILQMVPPLKETVTAQEWKDNTEVIQLTFIRHPSPARVERIIASHNFFHPNQKSLKSRPPPMTQDMASQSDSSQAECVKTEDDNPAEYVLQESISGDSSILRIAPELKGQVDDLEKRFTAMHSKVQHKINSGIKTSLDEITSDIDDKIDAAIQKTAERTYKMAHKNILDTHDSLAQSITEGTRIAARLTGDIRTATTQIEHLRHQADNLTSRANESERTVTQKYLDVKLKLV